MAKCVIGTIVKCQFGALDLAIEPKPEWLDQKEELFQTSLNIAGYELITSI